MNQPHKFQWQQTKKAYLLLVLHVRCRFGVGTQLHCMYPLGNPGGRQYVIVNVTCMDPPCTSVLLLTARWPELDRRPPNHTGAEQSGAACQCSWSRTWPWHYWPEKQGLSLIPLALAPSVCVRTPGELLQRKCARALPAPLNQWMGFRAQHTSSL